MRLGRASWQLVNLDELLIQMVAALLIAVDLVNPVF